MIWATRRPRCPELCGHGEAVKGEISQGRRNASDKKVVAVSTVGNDVRDLMSGCIANHS
jgi:hypothetical protein